MKRYIKSSVVSLEDLSEDELNDIISEPNTSPDVLRSIIEDIPKHPDKYNSDSIVNLIRHPNLTESDIPKEWVADPFYQRLLLTGENAPSWVLLKIYKENPKFLYYNGEPNIYMLDLVRQPNLPDYVKQDIVQRFPEMFEGNTLFNFRLSSANILPEDEYPFNATEQYIEDIVKSVIDNYSELLDSDKCDVLFVGDLDTITSIGVVIPTIIMIMVKQADEIIGNAIQEALSAEGYQVDDWSYDET